MTADDGISLREHMDSRFESQEKAVMAALAAAEKAVNKAEDDAKSWRANANEWRSAMTDREARFATVEMLSAVREKIDTLAALVGSMSSRIERAEGRGQGMQASWGYLVGAIGLAATVIGIVLAVR